MEKTIKGRILIVDDEPNALKIFSAILRAEGYTVFTARNVDEAIAVLREEELDTVVTDLKMPNRDGMQLFDHIKEHYADIPVIFLTAFGSVETAVSIMAKGAYYYCIKPPDYPTLNGLLGRAVQQCHMQRELEMLKRRVKSYEERVSLIASNPKILQVVKTIDAIKDSESSVLVCGETGTGKEVVARTLHFRSMRSNKPFVAVNCATLPQGLIESELFGYEKGAFTGALSTRIGKFEEAAEGTIFLDEIVEMDLHLQSKLLRILQEREIERLGSNKKIKVNFRLICSSNKDLKEEVKAGRFREDLYYRINVVQLDLPPLRDRIDDIPLLVSYFLKEFSGREGKVLSICEDVMELLQSFHWPGNIRQLRNIIERAAVLAQGGKISLADIPEELKKGIKVVKRGEKHQSLKDVEQQLIRSALSDCKGNKSKVAKVLGLSRKALYKRLKDYQIH